MCQAVDAIENRISKHSSSPGVSGTAERDSDYNTVGEVSTRKEGPVEQPRPPFKVWVSEAAQDTTKATPNPCLPCGMA